MMMSLNKVMIIGRLGRDPEIRYTAIGLPVVSFSVATEEPYFDKNGERRERTEWHRVVVVAKLALVCQEHLKKGRQIYVEGRLHTSEFETKVTGRKLRRTEIAASHVQLLGTPVGEPTEVRGANEAIESAETNNPL
jgi:single-strand DNA-binding protein